jgi:hypothetical protein
VSLDVTPQQAYTSATEVVVTLRVTDTDGHWNGGQLDFGDGSRVEFPFTQAMCPPPPTGPVPPHTARPTDETRTYRHTYTKAGTYTVTAQVHTQVGHCGPRAHAEDGSASRDVTVTDDPAATNGPSLPVVSFYFTESMGSTTGVKVSGSDEDGHFVRYLVSWGDGSPDTVVPLDHPCVQEPGARYPSRDTLAGEVSHTYETYGQYPVTVRAVTAGCDGRYEQTGVSKTQTSM